jgi:hypothetical protein
MKFLFAFLSIVLSLNSFSQKTIKCEGYQNLKKDALLKINGFVQKKYIRKADLIRYDLEVIVNDSSYKVIGFIASYDCHSRSLLFDVTERTYLGNRIKGNDSFIKHIWVGDQLCIGCINVERNGKTFIIPGKCLSITD